MTGWIGVSLGDVTGIGPEVTLKALRVVAGKDATRYLILGDIDLLHRLNQQLELGIGLKPYRSGADEGGVFVFNPLAGALPERMAAGAPEAALAAVAWLREGARRCLDAELDALLTAPVNKEAIVRAGQPFVGQTELLSQMAGTDRTAMMLLGHDDRGRWLRVALATTHVPIQAVSGRLTQPKVERVIELAAQACGLLGLTKARVAVCGLNPHAGEGGEMGTEELTTIGPAVRSAQSRGLDVVGPLSADALFYHAYRGDYEAVVAMYHDQGLAPLKMVCFESGVNWTLGLPFVRTSPDHGTAYDIAGKGVANPSSMLAALQLARQLTGQAS
jgi:4-hydroxythreonine-4-phosphate dehydrogenase